jgi:diguanylate cyclase (GGDEF)-like protein
MAADPKRVLVVDDSSFNRKLLSDALSGEFEVRVAHTGAEALEMAAGRDGEPRPDLVLMDIIMPGMDGHTACVRLKDDPATRDIPVIFISSMDDAEDEAHGLGLGAVDYITKPFSIPIVKARVRTHVELKRQRDTLRELSSVDGLTRIANRRRFDEYYEAEWQGAKRRQSPVSVVMADIDHFKAYNDTYGHARGDECLRAVAAALKSVLKRPTDLLARYGGEEFVAVLPGTAAEGAVALAEEMRRAVADLDIEHAASETAGHVTVSLGVGTLVPGAMVEPVALVRLADEKLYEAKNGGRDRVAA